MQGALHSDTPVAEITCHEHQFVITVQQRLSLCILVIDRSEAGALRFACERCVGTVAVDLVGLTIDDTPDPAAGRVALIDLVGDRHGPLIVKRVDTDVIDVLAG